MSQDISPNRPQDKYQFISLDTGRLTQYGLQTLEQMWNQIAAGFGICPCDATTAANVITLRPRLNGEGARTYGNHMAFSFVADATTTAAVTAKVVGDNTLATIKVYIDGGATQAGNNDIITDRLYLLIYNSALDSGAGGLVLK